MLIADRKVRPDRAELAPSGETHGVTKAGTETD